MSRFFCVTAVMGLALSLVAGGARASDGDFPTFENLSFFGPKYLEQVVAAEQGENPEPTLEAFYKTLTNPAEKADCELRIARVYCQRTGHVDYAKAVVWYDKALVRDLPLKTQAMVLILRGNSHELTKQPEAALRDYVRGLLICLSYNLPSFVPDWDGGGKMPTPALNDGLEGDEQDPKAAARQQAERQAWADQHRESEINRREQGLQMQKYYYIEAIKRVIEKEKMKDADFRELVARLSRRDDRIAEVIRLAKAPNLRPVRKGEEALR